MTSKLLVIFVIMNVMLGCQQKEQVRKNTLSEFVVKEEKITSNQKIKVNQDIAEVAYKEYLAGDNNKSINRKRALQRLAEIQLDIKVTDPKKYIGKNDSSSIDLFKRRLHEFPDDKSNDVVMYQLANAYAVSGKNDEKIEVLEQLVDKYPSSKYFVESMFRLGESYLSKSLYIDAELALTSVIVEDRKGKYKNNALFKRAWSKYKQLRYDEAVADYNQLLALYPGGVSKNRSDQEFLKNIYKVYSSCITYLGIEDSLSKLVNWLEDTQTRFQVYENLSASLIKQDRLLDAAKVYLSYINTEQTEYRNEALISLSALWKNYPVKDYSIQQLIALEDQLGLKAKKFTLSDTAKRTMAENQIYIASYYHSLAQKKHKKTSLYSRQALAAYKNLIDHYQHADAARYMFLYAELLQDVNKFNEAIVFYQKSLGEITNKKERSKVSFALLSLSNKLFYKNELNKQEYIKLNNKYLSALDDNNISGLLLSFSEYLYNEKMFIEAISYIEENKHNIKNKSTDKLKYILASSYFQIGEYQSSEYTYTSIADRLKFNDYNKRLALAIFKQAESLRDKYLYEQSIAKFDQITQLMLDKSIQLRAQIDVSNIYMLLSDWKNAINRLLAIKNKYPNNEFAFIIANKLSVAYLNNNQDKLAAIEFENIYEQSKDDKLKRTAIWQAAELFETGGDRWSSVKAYKTYIKKYPQPSSLYVEAMNKLTELYSDLNKNKKRNFWLNKIIQYVGNNNNASERMKYLASKATIIKARDYYAGFKRVKLTVPLKVSLSKKKKVLKNTVSSLQKVNQYKMYDHVSESIYWIAETYYDFSKSLLSSERPDNLSDLELEQYDVLLEDQAIPFEDQAIRYYLQNMQALKQGRYGKWVAKSLSRLSTIYPSKYRRSELVETHINQFH